MTAPAVARKGKGKRHVNVRRRMVGGSGLMDGARGPGALAFGDVPRGSDHHSAILSEEKVSRARRMMLTGQFTTKELAERFGVTAGTMGCALRGKTWRHVEDPPPIETFLGARMEPPGPETRHHRGMEAVKGSLPPYVADWLRTQAKVPMEGLFSIVARFVREKADESFAKRNGKYLRTG